MVTKADIRRLAGIRGKVLSLYVNLDPTELPTPQDRETAVKSLLAEAERRQGASHADVERVQRFFREEFSPKGVGSVAVFCSAEADVFEVVEMPRAVPWAAVVDDAPFVTPLTEVASPTRWFVLLVNRRTGRMLGGTREGLRELAAVTDYVEGRHDQGGWSQANFQRHIDEQARDHVKHVCDELFARRRLFDKLLVATTTELWPEVQAKLHHDLKERLAGRIELDVEHVSTGDVLREATPFIEEDERRREREALDRLSEALARAGKASSGLDNVLRAVNERRVETLMLVPGFGAPGLACPSCDFLGSRGRSCPIDGSRLQRREDVVPVLVERVLEAAGDVIVLRHHEKPGAEPVAALLRY